MKRMHVGFTLLALAASLFTGCQALFSSSLASGLKRTSFTIPANLTTAQAGDIIQQLKSSPDPSLAAAVVTSLNTQIAATTDPTVAAQLKADAASAAIVSTGAGGTILTILNSALSGTAPTSQAIIDMVDTIRAGTDAAALTALLYLNTGGGVNSATVDQSVLNPTDYLLAAVVLASSASAAVLPPGTDPSTLSGPALTAYQADPNVVAATNLVTSAVNMITAAGGNASLLTQLQGLWHL